LVNHAIFGTTQQHMTQLVGGLEHLLFFHILGIITPTDELIFFRGVGQPPTSYGFFIAYSQG